MNFKTMCSWLGLVGGRKKALPQVPAIDNERKVYVPLGPTGHPPCDHCGGMRTTYYAYGLPVAFDKEAVQAGLIIYAGCCITQGVSMAYKCHDCGKDFHPIYCDGEEPNANC